MDFDDSEMEHMSERKQLGCLFLVLSPAILVAIGLMVYGYLNNWP